MSKLTTSNPYNNKTSDRVISTGAFSSFYNWETFCMDVLNGENNSFSPNERIYWADQIERAENKANEILPSILTKFNRYRANHKIELSGGPSEMYSVQGQYFDLGRVLSGEPECMVDCFSAHERAPQMLDIRFFLCSPSWLSSDNALTRLFEYYGPILDIIDVWEQNGVRCKITIDIKSGPRVSDNKVNQLAGNQFNSSFQIKDYGQALDLELICRIFMTEHVSTIQNSMVRIAAKNPGKTCKWVSMDCYNFLAACGFNPSEPDKIIFPSAWYTSKMYFKPDAPEVLLSKLGYPLPQTNY